MTVDKDRVGHETFIVSTFDCDHEYRATPVFYFQVFQEMASRHCRYNNVEIEDIRKKGKTWVLARDTMEISSYPKIASVLHAVTGLEPYSGHKTPRINALFDNENRLLVKAKSRFALIDVNTRKPLDVVETCSEIGQCTTSESWFADGVDSSYLFNSDEIQKLEKFSTFEPFMSFQDFDFNGHVNHIVYFRWMMDCMPKDYMFDFKPSFIDIYFQKEIHKDDKIRVECYKEGQDRFFYILKTQTDGLIVSFGRVFFKNRLLFN